MVHKYRKELGIKATFAIKPIYTMVIDKLHLKYPYRLRNVEIDRSNKVWSTDITHIKINGGTVCFATIIDNWTL
jgi:putative transposase